MAGVTDTGFETKSLTQIQNEISNEATAAVGSGFDTSLDTPQGQMIAVFSDALSLIWEHMQDVYSSFDLRQASGARLDQLGQLRNLTRAAGQTDESFRRELLEPVNPTRQAVNALRTAVSNVSGVTNVVLNYNDSGVEASTGLAPLTVTIAVTGGTDLAVAQAIGNNLVFGMALLGNTTVNVDDSLLDICRTIRFVRPEVVELEVRVVTSAEKSVGVCSGTSTELIRTIILECVNIELNKPGALIPFEYLKAKLISEGIGISEFTINGEEADLVLSNYQLPNLESSALTIVTGN